MPRHLKWEIEDEQGNENTDASVFATPFYMPVLEAGLNPGVQPLDRSDENRGVDGQQQLAENEYEPEGALNLRNYMHEAAALLAVQFGEVTTTAGDGVITDPDGATIPVGAHRHVFSKLSGIRPASAKITSHYGSSYFEARGVTVPETAFSLDDDGVKLNATLMANYLERLTSAPSGGDPSDYEAFTVLPMRRRNVVVNWGVGSQNIDTIDFSLAQSLEYVRDLGSATGWPSDTERANSSEGFLRLGGSLTRRQIDNADWDALIAATAFAVTISMVSEQDIGATSYPYSMWVEAPAVQFASGNKEALKNQARHQAEFDWVAGYDETAETDFTVTIVNGTSAYSA